MSKRALVLFSLAAILILGGLYAWTWTDPRRGLERRWSALIDAMEDREWERFQGMLAADYRDGFGFDRTQIVQLAKPIFSRFITLSITRRNAVIELNGNEAVTTARIELSGHGDPLAQSIIGGSRMIEAPTEFRWRRTGRPWEWELVGISNPAVRDYVGQVQRELANLPPGL